MSGRKEEMDGWIARGRDTPIKSCPSPVMAEADMSLLICRFCLWQRAGAHTLTITHRHTRTHTGQD